MVRARCVVAPGVQVMALRVQGRLRFSGFSWQVFGIELPISLGGCLFKSLPTLFCFGAAIIVHFSQNPFELLRPRHYMFRNRLANC